MKTLNSNTLSKRHPFTVTSPRNKIGLLTLVALLLCSFAAPASAQGTLFASPGPGAVANSPAPTQLGGADASNDPGTSSNSYNWAGYAVTGTSFTRAKSSWWVPEANCNKTPNAYSGFFVGIGGYSTSNFEAIGTESNCVGGNPQYFALWELSPYSGIITKVPVSSGDLISAEVSYSDSFESFTLTIRDETTGKSHSVTGVPLVADRSSAEWVATKIEDHPNLADFGTFSSGDANTEVIDTDRATDNSITGTIGDFGSKVEKLTMVNKAGTTLAKPSALSTDGSSFYVNWKHE